MNGRLGPTIYQGVAGQRTTRRPVSPRPECASRPDAATWAAAMLILALAVTAAGGAQSPDEPGRDIQRDVTIEPATPAAEFGKSLAVLIGVQNYSSLPKLKYAKADVELLARTLREVCKFDKVITLTDDAPDEIYRPTKGNIIARLDQWLLVANNGGYRRVLLYFSGHGFRDAREQTRLYFAPSDCYLKDLELTGVPQSYVQQMLDGCTRVPVKLLVLDCCHAGEARSGGVGASGSEMAVFKNAKGLNTLASCGDDQVSLESDDQRQGLFTYWLCEGLKGAANENGDTAVDSGELYKYVYNNVLESAARMGRTQEVVERKSDDWRGVALLSQVPGQETLGPNVITNSIGMKLVLIPAGEFLMGSPESDSDAPDEEKPQHKVRISKPFYLGVTEVTQEQYERVMGENPSRFKGDPQRPVEKVSWEDAVAFCRKLSEKEGRTYRLPTEAEWEYACRAGSQTKWSFGDDDSALKEYAWYLDNADSTTHPVAQKKPNAWGLYDMHGNVWEWCQDWYGDVPTRQRDGSSRSFAEARTG